MTRVKKLLTFGLVLANVMAFGLWLGARDAAAWAAGDYCDEHSEGDYTGCSCYVGPWSPNGCYDSMALGYDCHDGFECGIMN